MGVCKNCKENTEQLVARERHDTMVSMTNDGKLFYDFAHNVEVESYDCPKCGNTLANNEEEARAFLTKT